MASSKISALTAVPAVSGTHAFAVNETSGPTTKQASITQLTAFLNTSPALTGTPASPTAADNVSTTQIATTAFVQSNGPVKVLALTSNANVNLTMNMIKISGIDMASVGPGTYVFAYYIRAQSSAATTAMKFAVNHTGASPTVFCYNLYTADTGVSAIGGTIDQENNVATGTVVGIASTRIVNTTLGPGANTTDANADLLYIIRGLMVIANTGTLELYHGSETAAGTTVMAGTALVLTKVG